MCFAKIARHDWFQCECLSARRSAEGEREAVESHSEPPRRCWTSGPWSEPASGVRDPASSVSQAITH